LVDRICTPHVWYLVLQYSLGIAHAGIAHGTFTTQFLLHSHFLLIGIRIESACATNEICLNIQQVEKRQSDQVKTMGLGMFLPKISLPKVWLVTLWIIILGTSIFFPHDKIIKTMTPSWHRK
jgi:hypothetical protein